MNNRHSSYTGRYARTLEQAFGPYQRGGLVERYDPMPKQDKIIVVAGVVGYAAFAMLILMGWLP